MRAKKDLRRVYDFYSRSIGEEKAFQIIESVLARVDILSNGNVVGIGAADEEFKYLKRHYKKLIDKNLKITYRVNSSNTLVYINRVFDTRQNPSKNK